MTDEVKTPAPKAIPKTVEEKAFAAIVAEAEKAGKTVQLLDKAVRVDN